MSRSCMPLFEHNNSGNTTVMFGTYIWGVCLYLRLGWNAREFGLDVHFGMHIWGSHFVWYVYFGMHIWRSHLHLHLHFGCNAHLFWRKCTFKYNCIHMFTEEMTLIKHYCNPNYISSRIEENKINFASWIHEPHPNPLISHFRWDAINQTQQQSHVHLQMHEQWSHFDCNTHNFSKCAFQT